MLTRRHIRVKVMQSLYAFIQSQNTDLKKEEKFLNYSMENMYNLYIVLLNLLVAIQIKAEEQTNIAKTKYLATEAERNPNEKFINHFVLTHLKSNFRLKEITDKRKLTNWDLEEDYVKILYQEIINSDEYERYMSTTEVSFENDRNFIIDIYKNSIAPNDKLYEFIEDSNLTWIDDLPLVNTLLLKMFKKVKTPNDAYFLPQLFKDEEDKDFAFDLFRKTILNSEKFQEEIIGKTPNWDAERITEIDGILLKMAICEFKKFPSIPVKVTINEYLEIAKEYSTPKSSIFINGILDKLIKEYTEENSLNKTGRGLL